MLCNLAYLILERPDTIVNVVANRLRTSSRASSRRVSDSASGSRIPSTRSATPKCAWPLCVSRRCKLDETSESLSCAPRHPAVHMAPCVSQLLLSARAYHRILKPARTMAVLAGNNAIQFVHLAEALHPRGSFYGGRENQVELSETNVI